MLACVLMLAGGGRYAQKKDFLSVEGLRSTAEKAAAPKGLEGTVETVVFAESNRRLENPNRGFYQLYEFLITDEGMDYREFIEEWYPKITDISLMFIQVNLQSYVNGEITEEGLKQIGELFDVLATYKKQLIVRFVYDREGKIEEHEPESLDVIVRHMEQLESILEEHAGQIFIVQGVFTGNWGEMNGSRYDTKEDWRVLAEKLARVTDDSIYLGVRTPAQWRTLIPMEQTAAGVLSCIGDGFGRKSNASLTPLWGRLGLFNDGMLGSESDYGTYGEESAAKAGWTEPWMREEELAFQNCLCRLVPNGGEVIVDNPCNDLANAVRDMELMHVTYLNKWHDPAVLEKWRETAVEEEGCFDGLDGYTYMERRLGYRFFIESVQLKYRRKGSCLSVAIRIKNAGFAPIYREPEMRLVLRGEGGGTKVVSVPLEGSLQSLAGGTESDRAVTLRKDIVLEDFSAGTYRIYFDMTDSGTRTRIRLGNEQNEEKYGYCLGTVELRQ